jgi:hypothetical protein
MTDWKAKYAKRDLHRDELRRLSLSAPSQQTTFTSLFSGSSYHPSGGGGGGANAELRQRHISAVALERQPQGVRVERSVEELREQLGVISQVLHGIDQNIVQNHHANLDRFDGLREQITRDNRRLMDAIGTIRRESNCDLSDPTTYIYCVELMYVLIFRIFKFLCQLVFVVGNSFKDFLGIMPFPFSLLVFIAYIFQMILIFIIFDTTLMVSTAGISHSQFISHNSLFGHSNGAPEFMSPRDALYQGTYRSCLFILSQILVLLGAAYQSVLGRDIAMIERETGRYISSHTVVEKVKKHVVEPLAEKAAEKVQAVVNEVVNDQVGIMASIPGQLGEMAARGAQGAGSLASRGAEGAASLAGKALEGAASLAQGAAEGISARAERLRQIDPEDVKASARAAAEAAAVAGESALHAARRFGSRFYGGSHTRGRNRERSKRTRTRGRRTLSRRSISNKIPVFSILTKTEQKVFDQSDAGKKLKQIEHIINNMDYSKIQPNPHLFSTIRFGLNVAEKLFPVFVKELDRTVDMCKRMERQNINLVSNPMYLKSLIDIVS